MNGREQLQLPAHEKSDMHIVRSKFKAHRFKAMARKRSKSASASKTIRLYLPTEWVRGGFDADLRHEMYEALSSARTIPQGIIEAVSGCAYHSEVVWHIPPQLGFLTQDDDYEIDYLLGEDAENGERLAQEGGQPKTTGEVLAFFLAQELEALSGNGNAPVRAGGLLPPSTIAYIAFDLLQSYIVAPPGPHLQRLIQGLLKLSSAGDEAVGSYISRQKAAYILAQAPDLSSSSIAELVDVNRTTVSRWTKEPKFQARVSQLRDWMKSPEWTQFRQKNGRFEIIEVPHQPKQ